MSGVDLGAARARLIAALPGVYPWGEVVDALLPVVQAMVAEGAAKELRAAAEAYGVAGPYPDQLLNRADRLDQS